jgi:hypothetical protein
MTTDDKGYYIHPVVLVDDTTTTDQMIAEIKRMDDGEWIVVFIDSGQVILARYLFEIVNEGYSADVPVSEVYNEMIKTLELGRDGS